MNPSNGTSSGARSDLPRTQLSPSIPVRSSSQSNLQASSVSPAAERESDEVKSPPIESKRNFLAGSRGGSVASSRHSRKVKKSPPSTASGVPGISYSQDSPIAEKPRKRPAFKFLSFFVCCGSPDNANTAEGGDQALPARKAKILPQMRGSQATPVAKTGTSAADSSTGESKEVADDGIGGPPYLEHVPAAKPKMQPLNEKAPEKSALQVDKPQNLNEKEEADMEAGAQTSLPAQNTNNSDMRDESPNQLQSVTLNTATTTDPAEPSNATYEGENNTQEDPTGSERAAKQKKRDSDIEMTDAPPVAPIPSEQPKIPHGRDEGRQINLPPPPPRNPHNQGIGRSPSNATNPNEKQQSLLPPLQPRFKGKKCLVLDLDETLVHSSFKVGDPGLIDINID